MQKAIKQKNHNENSESESESDSIDGGDYDIEQEIVNDDDIEFDEKD